jgi:two-component system, NarL family, response regulator LiaR
VTEPVRVLVVDDHRMFAQALELLLGGEAGIDMVGAVGSGEEALEVAHRDPPHVALVDIDLPGMDGIETTRRLKELAPSIQVVIITAFQHPQVVARAIEAGACGFVPKTQAVDRLVDTVRRAAGGEMILPAGNVAEVLHRLQEGHRVRSDAQRLLGLLTSREVQILQAVAEGRSTQEVAETLFISPFTVQSHVKSILGKLGVHSKLEAVTFCLRHGLIAVSGER